MMKHTLYSLFLIALLIAEASVSFAQKIDLDRVSIRTEYIDLPENGALLGFNTYSVDFKIDPLVIAQSGYTGEKLTEFGTLSGFGFNAESGEFIFTLIIEKPKTIPGLVEERKKEVKNGSGQKVGQIKYVGKLRQAIPTTIILTERAGSREIFRREFGMLNAPFEISSQEFDNKIEAEAFTNIKDGVIEETILNNYKKRLEADLGMIQRTFSPKKKEEKDVFWEVDVKKAPDYVAFNQEVYKAKKIIESQSYNQSMDKSRQEMISVLKYWSDNVSKVNLVDPKATQKLKYAYLINLAKAQYWLEYFEDCEKTCQQITSNGYDKVDAIDLLKLVNLAKSDIKIAKVSSRHFYRKGFEANSKFTYGNGSENQIKDAGLSLRDFHRSAKKDLVKKTVKDTIDAFETDLSDFKCTLNGKEIGLKSSQLRNGSGSGVANDEGVWGIQFFENETLIPTSREIESFIINFYPNFDLKDGLNADAMIALLKEYHGKDLMDITVNSKDTVSYLVNGKKKLGKTIPKKEYPLKISVDANIILHSKNQPNADGAFVTTAGDQFKFQFIEAIPMNIGSKPHYIKDKGYLVTLMVPELTLNKKICMDNKCYLNGETLKIQNVTLTFLMLSR